MKVIVISIIPEIIESYVNYGVIKKAIDRKIIDIEVINVRHFSEDSYIDDRPYGGGAGMVIKVEPLVKATRFAKSKLNNPKCIYMSPKGKTFNQSLAKQFEKNYNKGDSSPALQKYYLDQIEEFLRGQRKLSDLPTELQSLSSDLKLQVKNTMAEFKKLLPKSKKADEYLKDLQNIEINIQKLKKKK